MRVTVDGAIATIVHGGTTYRRVLAHFSEAGLYTGHHLAPEN